MSEAATIPPFVNRTMRLILRSPIHGVVSKSVLLISFDGRKTGKRYTTPVSYSRDGDQVRIFTHAKWWKNFQGGAPVVLRIQGREFEGMAYPLAKDKAAVAAGLERHLKMVPSDAKYYDVTFDEHGRARTEEITRAAESVVMIRVELGPVTIKYELQYSELINRLKISGWRNTPMRSEPVFDRRILWLFGC